MFQILEYIVHYATALMLYVLFFRIARKWKKAMRTWYEMDIIFRKYGEEAKLNLQQKGLVYSMILLTASTCT